MPAYQTAMCPQAPSSWLVENADLVVPGARALDVACGSGRHALWLAERGCRVHAIDRDGAALAALAERAAARGLPITTERLDLERPAVSLGIARYDLIVVVHYLFRPLFPVLRQALAPGGVLVYETFTVAQAARGRPTDPAFLLRPGELIELVRPLEVLRQREGDFEGRAVAAVVARKR
jgi:SAM-dependent methyltransferase